MKAKGSVIRRSFGVTLILLTMAMSLLFYCEWRGSFADTFYVCRKLIWVLPLFAVLIGEAHYSAGQGCGSGEYITRMLGVNQGTAKRKAYLDYARVLAALMVILTHACSMQMGENVAVWRTNLLTACAGLGLVCNPLYVMISGALLLSSEKGESIGSFYGGRFIKVVVPMVVYYAAFLCISGQMSFIPLQNIDKGFKQILTGASGIVPHYWLIYMLISLYITAPFVRVMVRNLTDGQITVLFALILIEEIVVTIFPLIGVPVGLTLNWASWEGVFTLGYIILERRTKGMEWIVIGAGLLSACVIPLVLLQDYSWTKYVCNTAPTMVLFAGAILILLSKCDVWLGKRKRLGQLMGVLSKYSYSVILVHWHGLFVVTWGKIGLQPLRFGCIGGIVATVLVAMVVCLIMGFVADNTIVLVVQHWLRRAGKMVMNMKSRLNETI